MAREKFSSRLGFILVSAGCAVGLGNVWKFPYMCGQYGGAIFILIYLLFLVILGLPVMVCEFSVGRGSQKSVAASYKALQPEGRKWHHLSWIGVTGCYILMMFYTAVGGWMLYYFYKNLTGHFVDASPEMINDTFGGNGFVTIKNMPMGEYTVTQQNDWSWRYQDAAQVITHKNPSGTFVTFGGGIGFEQWLNGNSVLEKNKWGN